MSPGKPASIIVEIVRALLIVLWVYTATMKFAQPHIFHNALNFSAVTHPYAGLLYWLIPSIEALLVILLLIPRTKGIGLIGSLLLMTLFTFYIAYMLEFGRELPCSCGGIISKLTWPQHLWLNVVLTLLSGIAALIHYKQKIAIHLLPGAPGMGRPSRKPVKE